jgi:redox-sensitive bicupin YhaK (pirin superfamily)
MISTVRCHEIILSDEHSRHSAGFHVHPVFANKAFTDELSPFLMFDYATPQHFPPLKPGGSPRGVGHHPHRGFETVTIAFQGEVEHADSMGNRDVIRPGDVQWMTAGRGIIHQEFHSSSFSRKGGVFEMCQLWLNLPKKDKMTKPNYQPIVDKDIPAVDIHDALADIGINSGNGGEACAAESVGKVRVIAGSFHGMKGPASTFSPVELWDVSMSKNATVDFPFPELYNCIIFVRRGKIDILGADDENSRVGPQAVVLTEKNGAIVRIRSEDPETSILIMGGLPLNEPIAARGPFVMNTWDEIAQASRDYQLGNFGS